MRTTSQLHSRVNRVEILFTIFVEQRYNSPFFHLCVDFENCLVRA